MVDAEHLFNAFIRRYINLRFCSFLISVDAEGNKQVNK